MEIKKTFDTIQRVRTIRESHYDDIKNMTISERLAYYREKSRIFREKLALTTKESERGHTDSSD